MEAVVNFSLVLPHPTFTHHAVCPGRREFVPSKTASAHQERQAKTKRTTAVARLVMVTLGKFFDWRKALVVVQPQTFLRWHRTAFGLFWRWKSQKRGRPPLPRNLRQLVRQMARENPTWGQSESRMNSG